MVRELQLVSLLASRQLRKPDEIEEKEVGPSACVMLGCLQVLSLSCSALSLLACSIHSRGLLLPSERHLNPP